MYKDDYDYFFCFELEKKQNLRKHLSPGKNNLLMRAQRNLGPTSEKVSDGVCIALKYHINSKL